MKRAETRSSGSAQLNYLHKGFANANPLLEKIVHALGLVKAVKCICWEVRS